MLAYACEPHKGSEPEVGWQWALQMARFHDVTVLTRSNNRPVIERELELLRGRQPLPQFVYHDCSQHLLELKRRFKAIKLYYLLWQRSARDIVTQLQETHQFDLMHHVTFAGFRYPTAIWGHGVPCIWGPIGGIESIPRSLLPWRHITSLAREMMRNLNNLVQATPFHALPKRAGVSTLILVTTTEMQRTFARLGFESVVMPTIGLKTHELCFQPHRQCEGALRLLFVGNIITLKGVDLALEALEQSGTNATLTLVGTGNYQAAAEHEVKRLGLGEQVKFLGRRPRDEVLRMYPDYDIFLFPSLHDTGGYAVIEAMFNELPVICLDCGGPAVAVQAQCGTRVPLGKRAEVIGGLAAAIRWYDENRGAVLTQGKAAREVVLREYDWDKKGGQMNERYRETMARVGAEGKKAAVQTDYSGMGSVANFLHRMFTLKGMAAGALALLLIGAMGFISTGHLKRQAKAIVSDTLPGLSDAGQANANLGLAFDRTLIFLTTDDPGQRAQLRREIEASTQATTSCLDSYKKAIYEHDDEVLFEEVLQNRTAYLKIRDEVLSLAQTNRRQEAIALCKAELLPAYFHYKEAGDRLFKYNIRQGQTRGQTIMLVCTATQWVVAIIGVLIFIAGFLFGLFK